MAAKKTIQQPIDRPLSKAYLREFAGWSTAYPPGLSDPTSLRLMENIMITREGAAAVRPALRSVLPVNEWLDYTHGVRLVGGFEHFFLNDGTKALLFAVREGDLKVSFRVAVTAPNGRFTIHELTDKRIGFKVDQGIDEISFGASTTFVKYLQIDNKIFALSDGGEDLRMFAVGEKKTARKVMSILVPEWKPEHAPQIYHPEAEWINSPTKYNRPNAETSTTQTLISSDASKNTYNYGFYYTFENEVGESAPSQMTRLRGQRGWSQWRFFAPDANGNPTTNPVTDPKMAMDQLVMSVPESVWGPASLRGATKLNAYMATWSDQEPVPPEGILVGTTGMTHDATWRDSGWVVATAAIDIGTVSMPLPTDANRVNYSEPTSASQGLVAGDRMVLVNDRKNGALIRWTSNQINEYTNFSPSKGGGFKTLTSGNLYVPAAVKLWQNPQSVDTITILCSGVDGYSTAFYMAPAEINGQSGSTIIMGFEETTATPGTVSPYGVEVLNNALYHPLDTELMKSMANNYNISHATMTDDIANKWTELIHKQNIISTQHDNRLYYLVHNPDGEALIDGCKGNEVWVYDAAKEAASWSRWLVQGISLAKLEVDGKLYVAIARPESIYVFDPLKIWDDVRGETITTRQQTIPWKLETNTQGANRQHDAWAHLQQVSVTFGNWRGAVRYGIRGIDQYGRLIEKSKIFEMSVLNDLARRPAQYDNEDHLQIRADLKEWFFFAESVTVTGWEGPPNTPLAEGQTGVAVAATAPAAAAAGVVKASYGAINFVQYRFTPVSVNIGYEYGSVETFEYARASTGWPTNTDGGIPQPHLDTRRT